LFIVNSVNPFLTYTKHYVKIVIICDNVLQAKTMLKDGIDKFIEEKILLAAKAISEDACHKICDGDVILVYSRLLLCLHLLLLKQNFMLDKK